MSQEEGDQLENLPSPAQQKHQMGARLALLYIGVCKQLHADTPPASSTAKAAASQHNSNQRDR
jgi:hypothetical protein